MDHFNQFPRAIFFLVFFTFFSFNYYAHSLCMVFKSSASFMTPLMLLSYVVILWMPQEGHFLWAGSFFIYFTMLIKLKQIWCLDTDFEYKLRIILTANLLLTFYKLFMLWQNFCYCLLYKLFALKNILEAANQHISFTIVCIFTFVMFNFFLLFCIYTVNFFLRVCFLVELFWSTTLLISPVV